MGIRFASIVMNICAISDETYRHVGVAGSNLMGQQSIRVLRGQRSTRIVRQNTPEAATSMGVSTHVPDTLIAAM